VGDVGVEGKAFVVGSQTRAEEAPFPSHLRVFSPRMRLANRLRRIGLDLLTVASTSAAVEGLGEFAFDSLSDPLMVGLDAMEVVGVLGAGWCWVVQAFLAAGLDSAPFVVPSTLRY